MIPIENVYYMLTYAFRVLNQQGYRNITTEKFDNTAELMSAILAKGISIQEGVKKTYGVFLRSGTDRSIFCELEHPV